MKFVTFENATGAARAGVLADRDRKIVPLEGFESVQDVIDSGDDALDSIRNFLPRAEPDNELFRASTRLLAPLPRPVQIRDALCFLQHMINASRVALELTGGDPDSYVLPQAFRDFPCYYKANRLSVVGDGADVERPPGCKLLDYELELGIVIGKRGKNIPREKALEHVFGFTIFNDVSARDLQIREMTSGLGPAKGKDFDTGNVFGPCIVTVDEVDPNNLEMIARLNGEEISRGNTSQMDHDVEDVVSHVSRGETIHPGEIIGSGTVPLGCLLEHKRFLADGDLMELEIAGIGVLRNRVVQP